MHSILAVAGCHYRFHLKTPRQKCSGELYHSIQATSALRNSLEQPQPQNLGIILVSSTLLSSLTFANVDDFDRIPLQDCEEPFSWIKGLLNTRPLLDVMRSASSAKNSHKQAPETSDLQILLDRSIPGSSDTLKDFMEIFTSGATVDNIYSEPLTSLIRLMAIQKEDRSAMTQYVKSVESLSPQFVTKANALDPKVLLLLAYWLALICAQYCWWSRIRAKHDCWTICDYLFSYHKDEAFVGYLDIPATACEYSLYGQGTARSMVEEVRNTSRQSISMA